jgi:hypothetical protein
MNICQINRPAHRIERLLLQRQRRLHVWCVWRSFLSWTSVSRHRCARICASRSRTTAKFSPKGARLCPLANIVGLLGAGSRFRDTDTENDRKPAQQAKVLSFGFASGAECAVEMRPVLPALVGVFRNWSGCL